MDKFMERAIELAQENVEKAGQPFGAVLVKNGHLVAEGVDEAQRRFDVSAHAPIMAIRKAQRMMHTHFLNDYTIYANTEPCPMCLSAMYYAGIGHVYYATSAEAAGKKGFDEAYVVYKELAKPNMERKVKKEQMSLSDEGQDPLDSWVQKNS